MPGGVRSPLGKARERRASIWVDHGASPFEVPHLQ
jgi:hypothetical protein